MGGIAVYFGAAILIVIGAVMAGWAAATSSFLTRDENENRVPATARTVWRTRIAALALIGLGIVLLCYGPTAFQGPRDVGAP
jgi:hypothetical protein